MAPVRTWEKLVRFLDAGHCAHGFLVSRRAQIGRPRTSCPELLCNRRNLVGRWTNRPRSGPLAFAKFVVAQDDQNGSQGHQLTREKPLFPGRLPSW